jgi:hypothetical protein
LAKTSNQVDFFHAQGLCQQQHPQSNLAKIESMSELNRIVSLMKVSLLIKQLLQEMKNPKINSDCRMPVWIRMTRFGSGRLTL